MFGVIRHGVSRLASSTRSCHGVSRYASSTRSYSSRTSKIDNVMTQMEKVLNLHKEAAPKIEFMYKAIQPKPWIIRVQEPRTRIYVGMTIFLSMLALSKLIALEGKIQLYITEQEKAEMQKTKDAKEVA